MLLLLLYFCDASAVFFSIFLFDLGSKFLASKKQRYDAMLWAAVKL